MGPREWVWINSLTTHLSTVLKSTKFCDLGLMGKYTCNFHCSIMQTIYVLKCWKMGIHLYGDQNMCFCPRVITRQSWGRPQLLSSLIPYTPDKLCCDFLPILICYYSSLVMDFPWSPTLMAYLLLAKMHWNIISLEKNNSHGKTRLKIMFSNTTAF